jgi:hypothetical protein
MCSAYRKYGGFRQWNTFERGQKVILNFNSPRDIASFSQDKIGVKFSCRRESFFPDEKKTNIQPKETFLLIRLCAEVGWQSCF